MISAPSLKNVNVYEFEGFFTQHKVKGRSSRLQSTSTPLKYKLISSIIKEELESGEFFTSDELDDFLFNILFYTNNNHTYVYKYNEFFADNNMSTIEAIEYLKQFPNLNLDVLSLHTIDNTKTYNICTTRVEDDGSGKVKAIHILLRIGTETLKYGEQHVFAGISIDLNNQFVLVKFGLNEFEELEGEPLQKILGIRNMLNGSGIAGKDAEPLKLNIIGLNEAEPKEAIFFMFEDLSREAEALLNKGITDDIEAKIKNFLTKDMGLSEAEDDYIEQLKAVIYQDITKTIDTSLFKFGWVFRFHFREGDHTRATSKQDDRGPVYSSKTFWQLKELIYKEKEMLEAGFHWYLTDNSKIEEFVDVRLTAMNDTMIIHHYFNNRYERKEKEEFVLRKIAEHLS